MATPPTQTLAINFPGCGARFQVAGEMAGRKGRCAKCGAVFRVPAEVSPAFQPDNAGVSQPGKADVPQHIGLTCRVCQTLMYGRLDQVGQSLKCPDCGARTIVPPPQLVKPKKQPAALEGDQYELWGVDEAPSVAEMLRLQPKYIAVECQKCQTLMHATEDQVGKQLKCADCGTVSVVPPPERPAIIPSVLTRDGDADDLQIDTALDPGERPAVIIPPRRPMLYEEEREADRARQAARAARGDKRGPQYDADGHAVMPRWPLATRILPFLFSSGVPIRWFALSAGAVCFGGPILYGGSIAMMGGFGAIGGMSFIAMGLIVLAIWLAALAAILMTIVVESSEGSDEVQRWPATTMTEWLGELFTMLFASLASPLPGWLIGQLVPDDGVRGLLFVGSMYIFFPVILLSQLDIGSAFAVGSARVIASLARLPGTWLMFYGEIGLLAAGCIVATIAIMLVAPIAAILLAPLYVAAVILSARILGRLAWRLAESDE